LRLIKKKQKKEEAGEEGALERLHYRGYSKLRTRIVLGSYGRVSPRSIGPP
jgi:hypothetical protein